MPTATVSPIGSTDRRVGLTSAERWPWICSRRACSISHPELHPFKHRPLKEGKLIMIGTVCCPRLSKKSLKRVRPVNQTLKCCASAKSNRAHPPEWRIAIQKEKGLPVLLRSLQIAAAKRNLSKL